jgi:hypothetical protein
MSAVFEAMLTGWATQQRARFLRSRSAVEPRVDLVRRFSRFSNQYPWEWEPTEVEAFMASLSVAASTARNSPRGPHGRGCGHGLHRDLADRLAATLIA